MNAPAQPRTGPATMAVRRRSAAERRALALLRSGDEGGAGPTASAQKARRGEFDGMRLSRKCRGLALCRYEGW